MNPIPTRALGEPANGHSEATTATKPAAIKPHYETADLPPAIEVTKISKRFGSLQALQDVSLNLRPGTFHALLGENGAGKSTMVKCMMGTYKSDTGSVRVGTSSVELSNPRQAHALGIGMVYQHFTLVENMTVVENMVMARGHVPAVIKWKQETEELREFMKSMPFQVEPTSLVRNLAAGQKQKVEILKQLYLKRKVIILDEPTSVLTPQEADEVLGMLRKMCTEGKISILIITHKFREVMAFCDEITVLRHGKHVGAGLVSELTPETMAKMMMGEAVLPEPAARRTDPYPQPSVPPLVVNDLTANDDMGVQVLRGIKLKVGAGEIVGIAGVSGNGQRELVQVLADQRQHISGFIVVNGEQYYKSRAESRKHKLNILPEMPLQNGCVGNMTTAENLAFRNFDRPPMTLAKMFLNKVAKRRHAETMIAKYRVSPAAPTALIRNLSGGNIQRAVLARELGQEVQVLIAANPCFGLDFKAVADIRSQIMEARNRGAAVLLLSEDLDEILELADRILVISGGKIVYETTAQEAERQTLGRHMAGH